MFSRIIILLLVSASLSAQEFLSIPRENRITIRDSMALDGQPANDIIKMLEQWGTAVSLKDSASSIISTSGKKLAGEIAMNLHQGSLSIPQNGNFFNTPGILTYTKSRSKNLGSIATSPSFGGIRYHFNVYISASHLLYEFTHLEFSRNMVHYVPFEQAEPPGEDVGKSGGISNSQKNWKTLKEDYTEFLKALSDHLKIHAATALADILEKNSLITYENYKMISLGMNYSAVTTLLQDEGKELSNSQTKSGGKTVSLQSVIWKSPKGDKSITVSFENGKVSGKAQTNL